ncbi:MAG: ankyrin repeat domain-containing protein [Armatimonadota bacterium]
MARRFASGLLRQGGAIIGWRDRIENAIQNGELTQVKKLLRFHCWLLNESWSLTGTLLHTAAFSGKTDIVAYLISKGASVKSRTGYPGDKITPLHAAAYHGHTDAARVLIVNGADVNALDMPGQTPLYAAAHNGHRAFVKLLVESGARCSKLHVAALLNDVAMAQAALAEGAEVNARAEYATTPLHWSAWGGDECEVANLLISLGADVSARSSNGMAPLEEAIDRGRKNLTQLLMSKGAEIGDGASTLREAAIHGWADIVEELLNHGAHLASIVGYTPLHFAAYNGHLDVARVLIRHHANVNAPDSAGRTPLHEACEQGHIDIARLLVDNGALASSKDNSGKTPLDLAIEAGNDDIASLLRVDSDNSHQQ